MPWFPHAFDLLETVLNGLKPSIRFNLENGGKWRSYKQKPSG